MSHPDDWTVTYLPGAITRTVMWAGREVANINPRGDFTDETERDLAAGIAHAAKMHMLLRDFSRHCTTQNLSVFIERAQALLASVETIDTGRYVEPDEDSESEEPESLWECNP